MKLKIAIALLGAVALRAQTPEIQPVPNFKLLIVSDITLLGADVGDILSSRGMYEIDPLAGVGKFGAKQTVLSLGMVSALMIAEIPLVRRWPKLAKVFAIVNFGAAGSHGFGIVHNMEQR